MCIALHYATHSADLVTATMRVRLWCAPRYFYSRPELASMFVVNNDLEISPDRTFEKLNKCLLSLPVRSFGIDVKLFL